MTYQKQGALWMPEASGVGAMSAGFGANSPPVMEAEIKITESDTVSNKKIVEKSNIEKSK